MANRIFVSQGFDQFVVCSGHFSDQLKHHIGDGRYLGAEVSFSEDGETLLGTGGALVKAYLLGEEFIVMRTHFCLLIMGRSLSIFFQCLSQL